jgi:GH24 family phage-related lysozyme (muramidase)
MRTLALFVLLLAGCARPAVVPPVDQTAVGAPDPLPAAAPIPVEEAAVSNQPLPVAVEAASGAVAEPILAAQEALADLTPVLPPPEPANAACRRAAAALIIRWEVSSPEFYRKRLERPIWPGGASGITWGIGYDGGHQTQAVIEDDWQAHLAVARLATTAGLTGKQAAAVLGQYRDIPTAFDYASRVFEERSLIEYERRAERAFKTDFSTMKPGTCAALVSLVYNRGGSMTGDSRREMRNIRDQCLPADHACTARELRKMERLWRGTVNYNGLSARREAEAQLAEGT